MPKRRCSPHSTFVPRLSHPLPCRRNIDFLPPPLPRPRNIDLHHPTTPLLGWSLYSSSHLSPFPSYSFIPCALPHLPRISSLTLTLPLHLRTSTNRNS